MNIKQGTYRADISSKMGRTTLDLVVRDGHISGQDSELTITGTYELNGDLITAEVAVRRHNFNGAGGGILGSDNADAKFEGAVENGVINLTATGEHSMLSARAKLIWVAHTVEPNAA